MKIFFTCSTKNIVRYEQYYRAIRDQIIEQGHKLTRDWIDYSINVAQRDTQDVPSYRVYKDVMTAILTADTVIADVSVKSMSLGHQITYALLKGKPVLLTRNKKVGESAEKLFVEGSDTPDLKVAEYSSTKDIPQIVKRFLSKFENVPQKRFNLVLTGNQDDYLNWASYNYKRTKTEIIHEVLDKDIERDPAFKKYLSRQT